MNLRLLSPAELLAVPPEPHWLWKPFLPEGILAMLAAYMKLGKSTFAYALAVAVAQGRPFLGQPTQQAGVVILAVEEHIRDIGRRLQRFGMQSGDPIRIHGSALTNSEQTLSELSDLVRGPGIDGHRIKLLIVDTLSRFWTISDENKNAEVVGQVSPLLDLAHETGVVVLLVHHERKGGGEDGRGIRGASALLGLVDQALTLKRPPGPAGPQRVLEAVGRYAEYTPATTTFKLDGDTFTLVGTSEMPGRQVAEAAVWAALSDTPQTVPSLSTAASQSGKATKRALRHLGSQVVKEGTGVKGDPYTYRRAPVDSIPANSPPIGEETNSAEDLTRRAAAAESAAGNGYAPAAAGARPRRFCPDFASIPDWAPGERP